jgi:hypothetical protein
MSLDRNYVEQIAALQRRLCQAQAITPVLLGEVISQAGPRYRACVPAARARVDRLFEEDAWVDALLALLELELPQWSLRRLVCEDGEWHCSLSRQPGVPIELDDVAEAFHESLPLAILSAVVEARRMAIAAREDKTSTVPQIRPTPGHVLCCDNFA